jgi:hypothetical protein
MQSPGCLAEAQMRCAGERRQSSVLNRTLLSFPQRRSYLWPGPRWVSLQWDWDTAQGPRYSRGNKTTAMSLKDHTDTWVNATTFFHTYKVQEGVTAWGQSPCRAPRQVRLVLHRGAPPSSQFIQAENARSFIHSRGRATKWQDRSYSGESDPLARRGTCRRESLDARCSWESEDIGECILLCPQ